eukprot:13219961-Heterocapsa_arctica.AAC.1
MDILLLSRAENARHKQEEFDTKQKELNIEEKDGVIITLTKDGVIITPKEKIEKAVQETDCLDKHQPAEKDEYDTKQKKFIQQKELDAPIQVMDTPNVIKRGHSPVGFVRCGRA